MALARVAVPWSRESWLVLVVSWCREELVQGRSRAVPGHGYFLFDYLDLAQLLYSFIFLLLVS